MSKTIKINERLIDIDRIQNPKLKRVIDLREKWFMFNYGDSNKYEDHTDHTERYSDSYKFWEKLSNLIHADIHKYDSPR